LPIPQIYKQDIHLIHFDKNIKTVDRIAEAIVTIKNTSNFTWSGQGEHPIHFSYRWLDETGKIADFDKTGNGMRTILPTELKPGQKIALLVSIKTPPTGGKYTLVLSMVEEGRFWFYEKIKENIQVPLEFVSH
jgi:hypothetical protein